MSNDPRPPKMEQGRVSSPPRSRGRLTISDGKDAEPADKVEIWAKRIGRGLSLIAFVASHGISAIN